MQRTTVLGAIFAVVAAFFLASPASAHADKLPQPHEFIAGIPSELANPGGSLPGSNDWSCRPSPEHPNPVVLAHGTWGGAQTNWGNYVPLLANEGYCVYSLTYGAYDAPWPVSAIGGMLPMQDSAAQLGSFVDRVRAATGAQKVDIAAYSQGGIVANYYIKRLGGAASVDKVVALGSPWRGTNIFAMGDIANFVRGMGLQEQWGAMACRACAQMDIYSPFIRDLNADGVYHPDVTYTNIVGTYDEVNVPAWSVLEPGPKTTNIIVQDGCPEDLSEHLAIAGSPRVIRFVLNALDPDHAQPVPCHFVPPVVG